MQTKKKWCSAGDAGKYFGLATKEIVDLVAVMEEYKRLFADIDLKTTHRFVMRSGSNYEFYVRQPSDLDHGLTSIEIRKIASIDENYEILEFKV